MREVAAQPPRARRLTLVYASGALLTPPIAPVGSKLVVGRDPGLGGFAVPRDPGLSGAHFELTAQREGGSLWIRDLEFGAPLWVDGKQTDAAFVESGSIIRAGSSLFVASELPASSTPWVHPADLNPPSPADPASSLAKAFAELVADALALSDRPVLIEGPIAAGHEELAQRIHHESGRPHQLFTISCASLHREDLNALLLGGTQAGIIERADEGTIFLDELDALPLEHQRAVVRVIRETKARIIAATHRLPAQGQREEKFDEELWNMFEGTRIFLPALKERREEILSAILLFLGPVHPGFTIEAAESLLAHDWLGNIRELREVAIRLRLQAKREKIDEAIVRNALRGAVLERPRVWRRPTREQLADHLQRVNGNVTQLAKELDEHRTQIQRWLKSYGLDPRLFRSRK